MQHIAQCSPVRTVHSLLKVACRLLLCTFSISVICVLFVALQNPVTEGEKEIKAYFAKLNEDMQEAFRKLEE